MSWKKDFSGSNDITGYPVLCCDDWNVCKGESEVRWHPNQSLPSGWVEDGPGFHVCPLCLAAK